MTEAEKKKSLGNSTPR